MAAKILIIGPQRCGKTRIANCLSDFEASPNFEQYNQTAGVRILESERVIRVEGRSVRQQVRPLPRAPNLPSYSPAHARAAAQVEIWDCSGDKKYENCWPAILRDAHGVIMVYDPTVKTQEKDIELWHKAFVHGLNLPDSQARDAATPPPLPCLTCAEPLLEGSVPHRARRALSSSSALAAALATTPCHRLLLHRRPRRLVLHHRPRRPPHLPRRHRHHPHLFLHLRAGDALLALAGGRAYGGRGAASALALQIHALAHVARQRGPDGDDAPGDPDPSPKPKPHAHAHAHPPDHSPPPSLSRSTFTRTHLPPIRQGFDTFLGKLAVGMAEKSKAEMEASLAQA